MIITIIDYLNSKSNNNKKIDLDYSTKALFHKLFYIDLDAKTHVAWKFMFPSSI